MDAFGRENRSGRLYTQHMDEELALFKFHGHDYINDLYEYHVEAISARDNITQSDLLGTHASIELRILGEKKVYDGIICAISYVEECKSGFKYRLTLRPWVWLASQRRNQRIFHQKTVLEIIKEVLDDYKLLGISLYAIETTQDFPIHEYTVQYRETDLEFIRRQMERHAISFHFRHEMGTHTLVLTTDSLAHRSIGERTIMLAEGDNYRKEHLWECEVESRIVTGSIRTVDYNFKTPQQLMEAIASSEPADQVGAIESFDYPGDYLDMENGTIKSRMRERQERGYGTRYRAKGNCMSISSGYSVTVHNIKGGDATTKELLCIKAKHRFDGETYATTDTATLDGDAEDAFVGEYVLIPVSTPLASPRRTRVSRIEGVQTAIVVGEDEIDCDEFGRILVRFHWDIHAKYSMRCRVSQNWSGGDWGGMIIPRVGMEVVVEFLEGDPDKPLVVGTVFNGANGTPYRLPAGKTKAVWRSKTHKQTEGFNEISLEDKKDGEEILIHAERHKTELVPSISTEVVGGGRSSFNEINQHIDTATVLTKNRTPGIGSGSTSLKGASNSSADERYKVRR